MAKYLFLILLVLAATWANSGDAAKQQPAVAKRPQGSSVVWADLEVTLIGVDSEDHVQVYGDLSATPTSFSKRTLFHRSSTDPSPTDTGSSIQLSTSQLAVPVKSNIEITASLYKVDTSTDENEIAMGSVQFQARSSGSAQDIIRGKNGKIQVKVTWH